MLMPISSSAEKTKRPYLARDDRRRQLLDVAADIVENRGWDQLTMSALAKQSATSRQLIYQHFDSLDALLTATGTHIFEQVYLQTRTAIEQRDGDIANVLIQTQEIIFDLPSGRAQALWQIIAAALPAEHALSKFGRRMRHLITNLWRPAIAETFGLSDREAEALAWPLIMAFWGNYHLMQDGELSRKQAIDKITWLVSTLAAGLKVGK